MALRSQMESGLNIRGKKAVSTVAMADALTMLMKLPADVQAAIDMDALSQAYYDFLTSGKEGQKAAQAKAADLLFNSIQAAIATSSITATTAGKARSA